jgi:hypothetical protein
MKIRQTLLASSLAAIFLSSSISVSADTGVFVGVVYDFGSNAGPGLSVKLVSDDEDDKAVAAIGVSYFPRGARRIGVDVSAGYTFDNGLVTAGYDFVNGVPQIGIGYMDTDNGTAAAPVATPTVETDAN